MASNAEYQNFGKAFLEEIIDFIRDNFSPDDVYNHDQLCAWAKGDNATIDELISQAELDKWALAEGYIKKEEV